MQNQNAFSKPYSDVTAKLIDDEVRVMIEQQYERAQQLLHEKRDQLETLANRLLEKEVLFKDDLEALFGKRPFDRQEPTAEQSGLIMDEEKQPGS